jgi:hypothetical protein
MKYVQNRFNTRALFLTLVTAVLLTNLPAAYAQVEAGQSCDVNGAKTSVLSSGAVNTDSNQTQGSYTCINNRWVLDDSIGSSSSQANSKLFPMPIAGACATAKDMDAFRNTAGYRSNTSSENGQYLARVPRGPLPVVQIKGIKQYTVSITVPKPTGYDCTKTFAVLHLPSSLKSCYGDFFMGKLPYTRVCTGLSPRAYYNFNYSIQGIDGVSYGIVTSDGVTVSYLNGGTKPTIEVPKTTVVKEQWGTSK